jgi:hypothetical protein
MWTTSLLIAVLLFALACTALPNHHIANSRDNSNFNNDDEIIPSIEPAVIPADRLISCTHLDPVNLTAHCGGTTYNLTSLRGANQPYVRVRGDAVVMLCDERQAPSRSECSAD